MAQQLTHIELLYLSFIGPDEFVNAFARELSSPLPSKGIFSCRSPCLKVYRACVLRAQLFYEPNSLYAPKRDYACNCCICIGKILIIFLGSDLSVHEMQPEAMEARLRAGKKTPNLGKR